MHCDLHCKAQHISNNRKIENSNGRLAFCSASDRGESHGGRRTAIVCNLLKAIRFFKHYCTVLYHYKGSDAALASQSDFSTNSLSRVFNGFFSYSQSHSSGTKQPCRVPLPFSKLNTFCSISLLCSRIAQSPTVVFPRIQNYGFDCRYSWPYF